MDKNTDNLLRAILRCAIATENHRTNAILKEDLPQYVIVPTFNETGNTLMRATIITEREYKSIHGIPQENTLGEERYFASFNTLNKYFFKTSSPVVKQGYHYLRFAFPENRIREVLADIKRPNGQHKVYKEIRDAFFIYDYANTTKNHEKKADIKPEELSIRINEGLEERTGLSHKYDFEGLLEIMRNDLNTAYDTCKNNPPIEKKSRNTVLNYLSTYTLLEYYFYRKTINDHYFSHRNGAMFKNVPKYRIELLNEALATQIYPLQSPTEPQNKPLFKNPMMESVLPDPITHSVAKKMVEEAVKQDPSILDDAVKLLNDVMCQRTISYHGEKYDTMAKRPKFATSGITIRPASSDSKDKKIICTLETKPGFILNDNRIEKSDKIERYFMQKAQHESTRRKRKDPQDPRQIRLFP